MLVLTRKIGEKITIGDNICVTLVDIDQNRVRLGIEAPQDVKIFRAELDAARQAEISANTTNKRQKRGTP